MTKDEKTQVVLDYISLHVQNKVEKWVPENKPASTTLLSVYDDIMNGIYGDLVPIEGGYQLKIDGSEREDGKPFIYSFQTDD
ncbi:MAG: hypothetical protein COA71_00335 [SAR86 cluster bacterium]|uniref:Uncharacterized protein n=1 Tax=SAR86 cluster bacterium TaxID=2030880 RepID=A0A2A5CJ10_9GAMM|nr:MAG: hypothetical protein COA71_00335 [SAR86 cluster bacterium]